MKVAVIMGSKSDLPTMQLAIDVLKTFDIPYHLEIVSAHRTPERLFEFSKNAEQEGFSIIIAGAGGAAHLPGMVAAMTHVPVIGVPIKSHALKGMDSLLSIVQMPGGVPVATMAIGDAGAKNAGLYAAQVLAINHQELKEKIKHYREEQKRSVELMNESLEG